MLTARDPTRGMEALASLVKEGLQNVAFHELDVESSESIANFAIWLKKEYGGLDILINNAGVVGSSVDHDFMKTNDLTFDHAFEEDSASSNVLIYDFESGRTCISINYYGSKRTTELLLPLFRASPTGARIVNVSSSLGQLKSLPNENFREQLLHPETLTEDIIEGMLGRYLEDLRDGHAEDPERGWPKDFISYRMSKIALNGYSRVLARNLESRPEGQKIHVNAVNPGWTKTDLNAQTGKLLPSEAAEGVVWVALLPGGGPSGEFFEFKRPLEF